MCCAVRAGFSVQLYSFFKLYSALTTELAVFGGAWHQIVPTAKLSAALTKAGWSRNRPAAAAAAVQKYNKSSRKKYCVSVQLLYFLICTAFQRKKLQLTAVAVAV